MPSLNVKLRAASLEDRNAIGRLHLTAFDKAEASSVANLALTLLSDPTATPLVTYLAEVDGEVVGSIMFSSCHIVQNTSIKASILAPLAVAPEWQRQGIGGFLIEQGLAALGVQKTDLVFVYGDPKYYMRFGFNPQSQITAPFSLQFPDAWMVHELTPTVMDGLLSDLTCCESLSQPQYW